MNPVSAIYIPYAGEPLDLLRRSLAALDTSPVPVVVIDNSHGRALLDFKDSLPLTPPVPLTLWQTMWMLCQQPLPFLWTQCDAIIRPSALPRLLAKVGELAASREPWGTVFTHYDIFCAVNAPELCRVGVLPDLNLPHYHGDPDWYRRMQLAGLPTVDIGGEDVEHSPGGGGHWRNAPDRDLARQCMDSGRYYREKWGGDIGDERYTTPWGENP